MTGRAGGVDKYLLNFLKANESKGIHIDFLTNEIDEELEEYLRLHGSKLFQVATLRRPIEQYRQVKEILEKGNYDMTYFNISTAIECIAAYTAMKMNIPSRVIHSHSSGVDNENEVVRVLYTGLHYICRTFLYRFATSFLACSKKAGHFMYPKKIVKSDKFRVIYNAVDRDKFQYDEELRNKMRKKYGVEDKFVIGHIGNFLYAKNYPFLIDIFDEVNDNEPDSALFLIGEGAEEEDIMEIVDNKELNDDVHFMGYQEDTNAFYQMFDLFLLPSRFEGLPVSGVEAQSAKLACMFSGSITKEAAINDHCYFCSLDKTDLEWSKKILALKGYDRANVKFLKEAKNYDLKNQKEQLREIPWL